MNHRYGAMIGLVLLALAPVANASRQVNVILEADHTRCKAEYTPQIEAAFNKKGYVLFEGLSKKEATHANFVLPNIFKIKPPNHFINEVYDKYVFGLETEASHFTALLVIYALMTREAVARSNPAWIQGKTGLMTIYAVYPKAGSLFQIEYETYLRSQKNISEVPKDQPLANIYANITLTKVVPAIYAQEAKVNKNYILTSQELTEAQNSVPAQKTSYFQAIDFCKNVTIRNKIMKEHLSKILTSQVTQTNLPIHIFIGMNHRKVIDDVKNSHQDFDFTITQCK